MNVVLAVSAGHGTETLLTLFWMLLAAKLMAEVFERVRQPAVVGEILAGVLIGPSVLALVAPSEVTSTLAEIGVIFLFYGRIGDKTGGGFSRRQNRRRRRGRRCRFTVRGRLGVNACVGRDGY